MPTSDRCAICKKPDLRRLVELGWNAKMSAIQIAAVFSNIPSSATILKHLTEHVDEGAHTRDIPVLDAKPLRERAMAIQALQVTEIERRIERAQERAAEMNRLNKDIAGYEDVDWSALFDILGKDMQAAVGSILKAVGLDDKKNAVKGAQVVDIYKMMLGGNGGLAPKALTAQAPVEGEYKDVTDVEDGT